MRKNRSTLSKAKTYKGIGAFWDTHDLSDFWDQTKKAKLEVDIRSEITYYSLDKKLADKVQSLAERRGVTPDTLINLWVQEKLQEQNP